MQLASELIKEFSSSIPSSDVIAYINEHYEEYEEFLKDYDKIFNNELERSIVYDDRRIKKSKIMD